MALLKYAKKEAARLYDHVIELVNIIEESETVISHDSKEEVIPY